MVQSLGLVFRLAGQVDAQLPEDIAVYLGKNHAGMNLGAMKVFQLFHCLSGVFV